MKNAIVIFTVALTSIIITSGSLAAQGNFGNNQTNALRAEMERTDQLIEQAKEAVRASQAPAAQLHLKAAVDLQAQARRASDNDYPRLAHRLTGQARERAKRAIAAGRLTEQGENAVLRKLERSDELLVRARELLTDQADHSYQAILQSAGDNISKAWEFYRSHQYRPAVMLANQAEKALQKLVRAAQADDRGQMTFGRRVEAAQELLDRAQALATDCASDRASDLVDRAGEAIRQGRELADSGQPQAALRALQQARKLATQVARECRGEDALRARYDRIKNNADRLNEEIDASDDRAQRFIRLTYEQLELAEEALAENRTEAAAAALKAAELTISQLKRHLDAGTP